MEDRIKNFYSWLLKTSTLRPLCRGSPPRVGKCKMRLARCLEKTKERGACLHRPRTLSGQRRRSLLAERKRTDSIIVVTGMNLHEPSQMPHANIVVTCTKRKRRAPEEPMKFRHIAKASIEMGFNTWVERVSASEDETLPARDLYAGDHWSVAKSLEQVAKSSGFRAAIWVCSAGYGLIGIDSKVKSYSATFSSSHPDTVCRWGDGKYRSSHKEIWWRLQTEWPVPEPATPRSITDLAVVNPACPLLVVASRDYMEGIRSDCTTARDKLETPDLLTIVSSGSRDLTGLSENLLPSHVSLRQLVGGSIRALNIRLARRLIAEADYQELRAPLLTRKCSSLMAQTPQLPAISRDRISDDDVRNFIRETLEQHRMTGHTALLRRLRDSGRACSQNRFARIFDSVVEGCCHGN